MKGPRSEATQAIFMFIRANEPVEHQALVNHFRAEAAAAGTSVSVWLGRRLEAMTDAGYVRHGAHGWISATDVQLPQPRRRRTRDQETSPPVHVGPSVAQPRRIDMFGPPYVPPVTVHREGALDHARHPSLVNGAPRAYRSNW